MKYCFVGKIIRSLSADAARFFSDLKSDKLAIALGFESCDKILILVRFERRTLAETARDYVFRLDDEGGTCKRLRLIRRINSTNGIVLHWIMLSAVRQSISKRDLAANSLLSVSSLVVEETS